MTKLRRCSALLLIVLALSSCSYRFGRPQDCLSHSSIYVPYIEGDEKGLFTNALIYAISGQFSICYDSYAPDYKLEVCLQRPIDTNIGFRYASGKESKVVTSNEARLTIIALVKLIDCSTGCLVKECKSVVASLDYDFESDFSREGEDVFSLGQLKMYNQARESSQAGLAGILAEKILDSLLYCW